MFWDFNSILNQCYQVTLENIHTFKETSRGVLLIEDGRLDEGVLTSLSSKLSSNMMFVDCMKQ